MLCFRTDCWKSAVTVGHEIFCRCGCYASGLIVGKVQWQLATRYFSRCISSDFHLLLTLAYSPAWTKVFEEGWVDLEFTSLQSMRSRRLLSVSSSCIHRFVQSQSQAESVTCRNKEPVSGRKWRGTLRFPEKWELSCFRCEVRGEITCLMYNLYNRARKDYI
jgi:hypothetical protein